jgi:hypothetical protein
MSANSDGFFCSDVLLTIHYTAGSEAGKRNCVSRPKPAGAVGS